MGIPEETTARKDDEATNAALAYIHEFGAPEANIPARPFLIPGVREAQAKITACLRQVAEAELRGERQRAERARHGAGAVAALSVQRKIHEGPFEPLKPATIAARRRSGRTSTQPLIDTGQLLRAITYVIRGK